MSKLTVLGIGNILMRDEGVGVRVMEAVRELRDWPADVEFIDGGAGGLSLLSVIENAQRLLVIDAAEMGLPPGEFQVITPEQINEEEAGRSERLSLHQVPFIETLRLCEQFARRPERVVIFAIQPKIVEHGLQLSEGLSSAIGRLARAAGELALWMLAENR